MLATAAGSVLSAWPDRVACLTSALRCCKVGEVIAMRLAGPDRKQHDRLPRYRLGLPNTKVKLRSFKALGFVSFNSLFDGVVPPLRIATTSEQSSADTTS